MSCRIVAESQIFCFSIYVDRDVELGVIIKTIVSVTIMGKSRLNLTFLRSVKLLEKDVI